MLTGHVINALKLALALLAPMGALLYLASDLPITLKEFGALRGR
jgi:hypothetical protein